jgi:hypothetical protein
MSEVDQVRDPLTPDEARAQVIATARELKTLLGIPVLGALAGLSSCNDQGEAPFRGRGAVHYPLARSREEALTETVGFLKTLEGAGWTILPPDYKGGQSVSAERNGVRVIFEVQGGGNQARGITVLGQCRDVTTTKATQGKMEPIPGL